MNDEIKEILDFLKQQVNYDDIKLMQKRASNITYYDIKQLLDYITNLQEENKELKELEHDYRVELKLTARYEKRIEKAIEKIKHDMKIIDLEDGYSTCEEILNMLQGEDKDE